MRRQSHKDLRFLIYSPSILQSRHDNAANEVALRKEKEEQTRDGCRDRGGHHQIPVGAKLGAEHLQRQGHGLEFL